GSTLCQRVVGQLALPLGSDVGRGSSSALAQLFPVFKPGGEIVSLGVERAVFGIELSAIITNLHDEQDQVAAAVLQTPSVLSEGAGNGGGELSKFPPGVLAFRQPQTGLVCQIIVRDEPHGVRCGDHAVERVVDLAELLEPVINGVRVKGALSVQVQ